MRSREKTKPPRITLVINSMVSGGAARAMANMANYWVEHGREVTLITLDSVQQDFYAVHTDVRRVGLGLMRCSRNLAAAVGNNLSRLRRLRQEIKASRPDVILSSMYGMNVLTLVASLGLGIPVIACEHTEPRWVSIGSIWVTLQYLVYPQAAALVVLTESARGWYGRFVRSNAVHVIPNPVVIAAIEHNGVPKPKQSGGTIAAMGRLSPEKSFDLLLKAFARCARKYQDWSLVILGEGDERSRLEALTRELGITNQVSLPGSVEEPTTLLRKADLFVLASRFEAFPMALMEAMACRLAVISTDCDSGPREIIRDGVDGVLVAPHDINALASAMDRLMEDRGERERLGARAVDVTERFGVERVMRMWENLLTDTCQVQNT
jgi:GalNAc-alpha-(1->4)-GalNAc-alpha-(1->3)-diNAcBac-PP-undecaprenol alpha-1,4-N-acetyl-D-galactosaminyltransferase